MASNPDHRPKDYFLSTGSFNKINKIKHIPYNGDELLYLDHEKLLSDLPIYFLALSDELLLINGDCYSIKSLYEQLYADTIGQKYIGCMNRSLILAFDALDKQINLLERKDSLTSEKWLSLIEENRDIIHRNYEEFISYLLNILHENKNNSFLPLRALSKSGSMNNFWDDEYLLYLLFHNRERIEQILSIYYNKQKEGNSLNNTVKRLVYTPSKVKKAFKHEGNRWLS